MIARRALGLVGLFTVALAARPSVAGEPVGNVGDACTYAGHQLWGRVLVVESFPDLKVKVVDAFPDLKVKTVEHFPDKCGKWKLVDSFPDIKIKFVDSFPDIKIKFVDSFPGVP